MADSIVQDPDLRFFIKDAAGQPVLGPFPTNQKAAAALVAYAELCANPKQQKMVFDAVAGVIKAG